MSSSPIRILVVDDEPELCTLSKEFLDIPGEIEVDTAYSVKEARNALAMERYHVIVSDYQMAGEDGIQFLKSLRSRGNNTPFILFTGKGREEVVIEALNNGADAYLQKGGMPRPMYAELEHRIRAAAEKRLADEENARTLSILESTMESTADGILVADGKGGIVLFNKIFRDMWNIPEEIIRTKDDDIALDFVLDQLKEPDMFIKTVRELYQAPDKISFDVLELKDGRVFERYSQPQRIRDSVSGRVWSFRDVTEQRSMNDTLKKNEALYRSILSASPDIITITDLDGRIIMVSPIGLTKFGHKEGDQVQGRSIMDYLVPEERERASASIQRMLQGIFPGPDEYKAVRIDGGLLDVEVNTDLVRGPDGNPTGLIIVIRDITERKRMESELRESEEFHRQLMSNLSMGVIIVDPITRVIENVNEAATVMFGADKEAIEGNRCHSFLCPAQEGACPVCDLGKEVDNSERILICANGSRRPIIKTVKKINMRGHQKLLECFIDISERKEKEEALRASDARFRALFDAMSDALWVIDQATGRIIDVNPEATAMYGYSREEFFSLDLMRISSDPEKTQSFIKQSGKRFVPLRYHRRKDGSTFPVEITANTFTVEGRAVLIGMVRDISDQKKAELELKESEARYRGLFDNMQDIITIHRLIKDDNGIVIDERMIDANPAALRTLEKSLVEEVSGKSAKELISAKAAARLHENILEMRRTGKPVTEEVHSEKVDRDFLTTFVPLVDDDVIITSKDITDRKRAEMELVSAQEHLKEAHHLAHIGMWDWFIDGDRVSWSPELFHIVGLDLSPHAPGLADQKELYTSSSWEQLNKAIKKTLTDGEPYNLELEMKTKNVGLRKVIATATVKKDRSGKVIGLHGTLQDITERKHAEEALKESEEKFREIFDRANDAIRVHGVQEDGTPGRFIDANYVACNMLGYTREEMLQMQPADISTGYYDPPFPNVLESLRTTGWAKFVTEHRHKDGSIFPVEINAHLVNLQGKHMTIAVVRDISETKRNLNALKIANQKLNLLSSITRHDIKNQLLALTGYMALIENRQSDAKTSEYLLKAENAAERISAMIQFTKTYEDIGVNAPEWHNVRDLVDKCSKEVHAGHIRVVNEIPADVEIFSDPLIVKVFYNLMDNAVRHGGKTTTICLYLAGNNRSQAIVCEDDGSGIVGEVRKNLFTKGFGKDHGLGLFLSREILAITGIMITENGMPGHGAKFMMTVPKDGLRSS